jgi:hypothetical protein
MTSSENSMTLVSTACRSRGGVSMIEMSRMPLKERLRVRGIGVADMAITSTSVRSFFRRSF